MVRATSCGMSTFNLTPNAWRISRCRIGDSANPPTRNIYLRSKTVVSKKRQLETIGIMPITVSYIQAYSM